MTSLSSSAQQRGFPILGVTFLLLLTLKLTGVSAVSWWWVFFPLYLIPLLLILFAVAFFGFALAVDVTRWVRRKVKR
jgi:hypothetical protein